MLGHFGLIDRAGVIIQTARDSEVDGEVLRRNAEGREIARDGLELVEPLVKGRVHAAVALERCDDLIIAAADGHEVKHVLSLAGEHFDIINEELAHFLRADLIELVDSAHNVPGALAHAVHGIEAVEDLAVVDLYFELRYAEL